MSSYYQVIMDILLAKGESYEELHPEIRDKNTFSISTLSHSSAKQVWWKLNGHRKDNENFSMAMSKGRAMHEYIQARLTRCVNEYPVLFSTETYRLTGHVDSVDFKNRQILEIKTSKDKFLETGRLREYMLQCGAYCQALELEFGFSFNGSVFVLLDRRLVEYELTKTDIANSWLVINDRAKEVYDKLQKVLP